MPSEILSQLITSHPILVDVFCVIYVIGWLLSHALRAGWPDEQDRTRTVRVVLALADAAQLVFTAPVKMIARKAHAAHDTKIGGSD